MQHKFIHFLSFSPLGLHVSQNLKQCPPGASPGPPGGGERTPNRPKSRQEVPKMDPGSSKKTFWAVSKKTRATLFRQDRPPEPHLPPKTPREASRGLQTAILDPPGAENSPPAASFFDPRELPLQSLARPFSTPWGTTQPTYFSIPGPAECAKRLNPPTTACGVTSVFETPSAVRESLPSLASPEEGFYEPGLPRSTEWF